MRHAERVYLLGIGRGVTVKGLWREERKRERHRKEKEAAEVASSKGEAQISLPGKGEKGAEQSLSLKGTGYPGDRPADL